MTKQPELPVTELNVADAAERAGVDRRTILRWIEAGHILARKIGGGATSSYLVDVASLDAWLESEADQHAG